MTQPESDHAADLQRNEPSPAHAARLAAGLKAHEASMRRSRAKVYRLQCSWFIHRHGKYWRKAMEAAARR